MAGRFPYRLSRAPIYRLQRYKFIAVAVDSPPARLPNNIS